MLAKATAQLVEEVFAHFGADAKQKAKENPEACLISMLTLIKKELPHVYATLRMSIELAPYDGYLQEAREKLEQTS
ncbi:MAG: hypothetical protein G01um101438_577 [Parcubacteria group bacterium Gr01-1014_38]|nr:MAG: hypothetical protein G01um101438_577 [Parcubacteria group bacterium Gr01-1014_38]